MEEELCRQRLLPKVVPSVVDLDRDDGHLPVPVQPLRDELDGCVRGNDPLLLLRELGEVGRDGRAVDTANLSDVLDDGRV
jgi:hypothetical protein